MNMRNLYYIELFIIILLLSIILTSINSFIPIFVFIGCLYILYRMIGFVDVNVGDIVYRPCSIMFEFYDDPDYRTYYEVLEKHKTSIIVKNKHDNSIKKIYLTDYIIFYYKKIKKLNI